MNFQVGTNLQKGKYVLTAILGQGTFGITYRASYGTNAHPVVIKTLNESLRHHPDFGRFAQKFLAEAQGIAQCQHPNLVRILDGFVQESWPCIVMEYIPGPSVAQLLQGGQRMRVPQAIDWIEQIGSALHLLHQNGCLHRDVKPQNMIRRQVSGEIVLTDFGMACEFTPGTMQTQIHLLSSAYAAPEQYQGHTTLATDIYALCATLYHLLVGQPPVAAQLRDRVPLILPRQLQPTLSSAIEQAILQGLQMDPYRRPQTVADWLDLLPSEQKPSKITRPLNLQHKNVPSVDTERKKGYAIPPFRQSSILKSPIKKPVASTQSALFTSAVPRNASSTHANLEAESRHPVNPLPSEVATTTTPVTVTQASSTESLPVTSDVNLHPADAIADLQTETHLSDSAEALFSETSEDAGVETKDPLGCWLPLLFIMTSVIAGLVGVIFGLSLRYGDGTASNFTRTPSKQAFPSVNNWPGAVTPLGPPAPTAETFSDQAGYADQNNPQIRDRITENEFAPGYLTTKDEREPALETQIPFPEPDSEASPAPTVSDDPVSEEDLNAPAVNAESDGGVESDERYNRDDRYDRYDDLPPVTPADTYEWYPDPRSPLPAATEEVPPETPAALETEETYSDPYSDPYNDSYSDPYSGSDTYYDPSLSTPDF